MIPEQSVISTADPDETYQALQKQQEQKQFMPAKPPVVNTNSGEARASSPDDDGPTQPTSRKKHSKARNNVIESSDDETSSPEPVLKTYSRKGKRAPTISSSDDTDNDSSENHSKIQTSLSKVIVTSDFLSYVYNFLSKLTGKHFTKREFKPRRLVPR